jgi:hypothetical protein
MDLFVAEQIVYLFKVDPIADHQVSFLYHLYGTGSHEIPLPWP